MAHLQLNGTGHEALTGVPQAMTSLREWAEEGEGHDAHQAFLFLLTKLPNVKPLFRIIQHHYVERNGNQTKQRNSLFHYTKKGRFNNF